MVCNRCIKAVENELVALNIDFSLIELGLVHLKNSMEKEQFTSFKSRMEDIGFEIIDDKTAKIIERIKNEIIQVILGKNQISERLNFSEYLVKQIGYDYSYLSNLFSSKEGKTIENYIINLKIERVKELIVYDELNLTEIAYLLNYSSVQHLSRQFKHVTGFTPSYYKQLKELKRRPLDKI